jgi:hypothetical protein
MDTPEANSFSGQISALARRLDDIAAMPPWQAARALGDILAASGEHGSIARQLREARQDAARAAVIRLGDQRTAANAIGISEPGLSSLLKPGTRRR